MSYGSSVLEVGSDRTVYEKAMQLFLITSFLYPLLFGEGDCAFFAVINTHAEEQYLLWFAGCR